MLKQWPSCQMLAQIHVLPQTAWQSCKEQDLWLWKLYFFMSECWSHFHFSVAVTSRLTVSQPPNRWYKTQRLRNRSLSQSGGHSNSMTIISTRWLAKTLWLTGFLADVNETFRECDNIIWWFRVNVLYVIHLENFSTLKST